MNMIKKIFSVLTRKKEKRTGTYNPAQWLIDWVRGGEATSAGNRVTEQSALKYTPFWAATRVISGTIASLPFIVYRRVEGGKKRVDDHPVFNLLHNRPNQYMDALTFLETRQAHVLTYGNGFAEIQRDGGGRPIALWPLLPDKTFRMISEGGIPYYEVRPTVGPTVFLPDYNVLHIKGLGFDGYTGYNVVLYHKEAIGYGAAVKEYGSRFFGNGANPGGILEHPGQLSEEAANRLKESWNSGGGLSKSHRTEVLEEGMKWTQMGVDPEHAQALEVQKYTVDDCSRIFNIPPHKIGSLERATFSNIEEQNIDFVTQTMLYWFKKWEQECSYKLLMPAEQQSMFCEILADGLLRGNTKARYDAYRTGRTAGFLSVNDIRGKENMNTIGPKGDIYLEPLNMKPAGTETPQEKDSNDTENNSVTDAHFELIKNQWLRVIHKHNGTLSKGNFDVEQYAITVATDAINALASLRHTDIEAKDIITDIIREFVGDTKIPDEHACLMANETVLKIGGDHARE